MWCILIFYLSDTPNLTTGLGIWDFILRKIAHMVEYFILAVLLYRAFKGSFVLGFSYLIFWPSVLSFLYAVSDEIHQLFVPTRNGNAGDVLIDGIGITFFVLQKFFAQK